MAHRTHTRVSAAISGIGRPIPAQTEVLVSRDQLRAIARLKELVAKGDLTDQNAPLIDRATEAVQDIRPAPLTLAPLTMPALTVSAANIVIGDEGSKSRLER